MDELKNDLNDLKSIVANPKIYMANYFDEIRTQIDIACQSYLHKQTDFKNNRSLQALNHQAIMINEVKLFEKRCLTSLVDNYLNLRQILQVKTVIDKVKSVLALENQDLKQIFQVNDLVNEMRLEIERGLFLNTSFLFLTEESVFELLKAVFCEGLDQNCEQIAAISWDDSCSSLFGRVLVIDDEYICQKKLKVIKNRPWPSAVSNKDHQFNQYHNTYTTSDLTTHLFKLTLETVEDIPLTHISLNLAKINACYLDHRLKHCQLHTNGRHLFTPLTNLDTIHLGHNNLNNLDPGIFKNLIHLETLNLENNKLGTIEAGTFNNLRNLKFLILQQNQLVDLNDSVFKELINLERLDLHNNLIEVLSPNVFQAQTKLRHLLLGYNKLKSLELNFKPLKNLTELVLHYNQISKLQENQFQGLVNLKLLSLSHNEIKNLPLNLLKPLHNLESLHLTENRIKSLLDSKLLENQVNLEALFMSSNCLESVDLKLFKNLRKLKSVNLDSSRLDAADVRGLCMNLGGLRTLSVRSNVMIDEAGELLLREWSEQRSIHLLI